MISKRLPQFFVVILLLAFLFNGLSCSRNVNDDSHKISEFESRLDSVITLARLLPDDAEQDKLVSLYYQSKQVMELVPDTSAIKAKAILFTMNKLAKTGGFNEAIKQGWHAIDISYKANLDDPSAYRVQTFGTLAELYNVIGKEDSTLIIYKMAVSDAAKYPNLVSFASSLNNVGVFFLKKGELDSALGYFHAADSLMNKLDDNENSWWIFHGYIHDNMASVFFNKGEYAKAKSIYLENYNLSEENNDDLSLIETGISLANTEIELENYDAADRLLKLTQKRLDSANLINTVKSRNQLHLLKVKEKYYEKVRDFSRALATSRQIYSLADSVRQIEQNNQRFTSGLLARYSSAMFQSALNNETMLHEADKQRAHMRFWIFVLIAMGMTITPTILLFYYRQNARLHRESNKLIESDRLVTQQKLKLEQQEKMLLDLELENKKKDLTEIALHLSKKQEWAAELHQRIKLIESLKGNKRSREFNALKSEIRNQLYIDKDRAIIIDNIDSLNAAFYEKLNSNFPSLTPTEMKLFSFIKLKMNNAQISQIQNINPDSVRMIRLRLRKKLQLDPTQDLDTFIQSF